MNLVIISTPPRAQQFCHFEEVRRGGRACHFEGVPHLFCARRLRNLILLVRKDLSPASGVFEMTVIFGGARGT